MCIIISSPICSDLRCVFIHGHVTSGEVCMGYYRGTQVMPESLEAILVDFENMILSTKYVHILHSQIRLWRGEVI